MKVEITHAKAPWPAGAGIGSVVQFEGGALPPWAVGKCRPSDAKAEFKVAAPAPASERGAVVSEEELAELRRFRDAGERAFQDLRDEHAEAVKKLHSEAHELRAKLADVEGELAALKAPAPQVSAETTAAKGKAAKA